MRGRASPQGRRGPAPEETLGSSPPVAWSFSPARLNAVGAGPAARRGRAEPACTTWSEKTQVAGTRNRARGSSPSRRATPACPQPDPRRGQLPNPGTPGTSRSKNPTSQAVRNGTRNSLAPLDELLLTLVSRSDFGGCGCYMACVTGVSHSPDSCYFGLLRPGRSRTGRSPAAGGNAASLRVCRKITRSLPESGTLVWYGRYGGNPAGAGGEVPGDLPAPG